MTEGTSRRDALPAGTELAGYRIEAVLGAGGFGITYLASNLPDGERVAMKEYFPAGIALRESGGRIVPAVAAHAEDFRRGVAAFAHEGSMLARFGHPHVVPVLACFEQNDTAYVVMAHARGETLGRLLKRVHALQEETLRDMLVPLLDGLRAVHDAGFMHRDIKPSNVFLRDQGGPMLLDFGAARFTAHDAVARHAVVTPGYSPPEQYASAGREGPWSDIYGLAAVAFRAVTGEDPPDALARRRRDTVRAALAAASASYSAQLLSCIGWGLELRAVRRPQTVDDWRAGLAGGRVPYALGRTRRSGLVPARRRDAISPYRWAVPIAVALGVIAWRAYDTRKDVEPAHAVTRFEPAGLHAVQGNRADAPPRLVEAVRERPTRERTSRPGRER